MSRNYISTRHPGVYYRLLANGQRRYTIMVSERGKPSYRVVPGNEGDAIRARAELLARKGRGERVAPSKIRFGQFSAQWLDSVKHRLDERTIDDYQRQLRLHLLPEFEHLKISALNEDRIAAFIAAKSVTHAGESIKSMLTPLSRILNHAVRRGLISQNPMRRLEQEERPTVKKRERRILDRAEVTALLRAAPERYRPLLATAVYTGLRVSELLGLTWADVDLEHGAIRVRAQLSRMGTGRKRLKTANAEREVVLAPDIVRMLGTLKLAAPRSGDGDYVFSGDTGRPLSQTNVLRRGLHRACETAALASPRPRFHDLRHTFASMLIAQGSDPVFVARQLGHSDPGFTLRTYAEEWERAAHRERGRAMIQEAFSGSIPEDEGRVIEGGFGG